MNWPARFPGPIWLASRSPRRRAMLEEAGLDVRVIITDFDDAALRPGDAAADQWVTELAQLKAQRAKEVLLHNEAAGLQSAGVTGTVLGADTVCVAPSGGGGEILGQPRDAHDARRMMQMLRNAEHRTITGVCLLALDRDDRQVLCDSATVSIGGLSDEQIDRYVLSKEWRGKAGAYNLSERIEAGWPIECAPGSDPATVMGLPMRRLKALLGIG